MRNFRLAFAIATLALCAALPVSAVSTTVVISQVYGAGGNSGATYRNDYVELFNLSSGPQSLSGWSLQYTSATGTGLFSAFVVPLSGSIPAGGYFLVQLAGGANGVPLPTPDLSSTTINMAGTAGKILLADTTTGIACNGSSTPCTPTHLSHFIDFVGWGNANFFEGTVGPATSTTASIFRNSGGCSDTDNNGSDFTAAAAAPRNSASPLNPCGPVLPTLSINDVTLAEGNSGTTTFTFTVSLSAPAGAGGVSFNYATADGTATQPEDYIQASGTGSIASGTSTTTIDVSVNGDTVEEPDETFFVNITSATGATILDGQGQGTITNDDIVPHLSISDVTAAEGNSGTTNFAFQVSITSGSATFDIATADGSATTADNDYVAHSLTGQTVVAGSPYTFNVAVIGDTTIEPDETFFVNVTNVSAGVTVDDGQGLGTILNDDSPTLTIDDVTVVEGDSGPTTAAFTVSLSIPAGPGGVTFDIATADGTATTADNDYVGRSLTGQTIAAGGTTYTFDVTVNGDTKLEPTETFFVNVTNVTGATVGDGVGECTITNDDPIPNIVINEILADPASSASGDANGDGVSNPTQDEFVELVNASGADLDISGWTLSDATSVRHTFPAGTVVTNNCSIVVFGGGTPTGTFGGSLVQVASTGQLGLNNAGDTVTLRLGTVTIATYTYGAEGGNDQSLTRSPDITGPSPLVQHMDAPGSGGARFSPGKLLTGWPFSGCTLNAFVGEIWQIQGSGVTSPYVGQYVTSENNVVTAVAPDGFFIQTPDARADASTDTSNGIFVYTNSAPTVAVGDVVNVTGEVKEYYDFTEIVFPTVTAGTGPLPMPAAVELNASTPDPDPGNPPPPACTIEYECWEGMRIHVAAGLVSGPNQYFGTDPFAEMFAVASPNRPFRSPGIKYPGLPGLPVWDGNPEVFELDPNRLGLENAVMPAGTPFTATGVLGYEFNGWELWPTELTFGTPPVLPRAVRAATPLEMTVGSLNLLNYNSATADYATRTAKHSAYIRTVLGAPDVVGVSEVENLVTLQGLATRLHADDPNLSYTAHLGPVDKSGIDVGFLVRNTVTNLVITQLGATEVFPLDGSLLHDRPPLLLEGDYTGNGAAFHFAVMVNHTRSFLGIEDPNPVEANRVRQKRLAQAQSIAGFVQTYQTAHPSTPFVLVGDYNAFEFTDGYVDVVGQIAGDAVQADNLVWAANITDPVLTKQVLSVPAAERYSYVFDGTSQVLDHALTTQATNTWVRGLAFGRGNSDAAEQFLRDSSTVLRGSDHDGLVLYLVTDGNGNGVPDDLDEADLAIAVSDSPDPVLAGGTLTYTLAVTNNGGASAFDVTVTDTLPAGVTFGTASGTGWTCSQASGVVTCTRPTLAVGPAPDITITVTAPSAATTLSNHAAVACPLPDPESANNSATEPTTVTAVTDLRLVASTDKPIAPPLGTFTHSAVVTNLGPSTATGVSLAMTVPAGTAVGAITPGACSLAGSTVTCAVGTLADGATFTATVALSAASSGTFTSASTVTGTEPDANPADNADNTTTVVGQVLVAPSPINMRVPVYSAGQSSMTITNDSPLDISYHLLGRVIMPTWELWPLGRPSWRVAAEHRGELTARSVPEHPHPTVNAQPLDPVAVLSFPSGLARPWGIGVNTSANDLWISNLAIDGGDDLNYRFLLDGTPTGDTIDTSSWVGAFAADMAFDPFAGTLWQVNVGGDNCIHEFNPATKAWTGSVICPDWGGDTERGLAYDGLSDTFFAGTWENGSIKRFNRSGAVLEDVSLGLGTSGLAFNPSTQHLFVLVNTSGAADLYVLDVASGYTVVAAYKVPGMGNWEQAGLEADCAGNLYAVNQTTKQVLVLPSGEIGFCNLFNIPWMTPTPASGPIAATATQDVTLDFITTRQWPGLHRAVMTVAGTTPFAPPSVPVNYTVTFLDVPDDHWADPFIHGLAGARVSRGCGSGNFCPDAELNRAEMAILMVRAMHGPLYFPPDAVGIFVDVPISDTDRTASFVEQLYRDGVVAGCAQGGGGELYYCPNELVSRAQMAVFVAAGSGIAPVDPPLGYFSDVHGTEYQWAEGFIEAIFNAGITAGCGNHMFCPGDNITRAQLAVWLVVAFDIPYLPGS
ncbi:MAG TPA: lamin tail domain-containing protein [Thermoanaerobaculaceae bacterium]|nr:lamin tail domain-containing protein [Thermoanaerobaculaceae bacterium]